MARQRYPVGLPTFSEIIQLGCVYVDKTDLIYRMVSTPAKYYFLSRPRRFGKSVLVSTLQSYFEGRKELFEGLKIAQLEEDWTAHPVLHFDMSYAKNSDPDALRDQIAWQFDGLEEDFDVDFSKQPRLNLRLASLIRHLYKKTGKRVVVLIDEYDAPLLDVVHDEQRLAELRQIMRDFYSPLKACAPYLRFVFLTGITKFSQLSIFSELNNLANISMVDEFAPICGITEEEMHTYLRPGIEELAQKEGRTYDETVALLKQQYDGYHFTAHSPDIYNPFSLLTALQYSRVSNYWFSSGTPTYIIELLRKYHTLPSRIGDSYETEDNFDVPPEQMDSIVPLLYQSGYLTIKDYRPESRSYRLDLPNQEVRVGLMRNLLPQYVGAQQSEAQRTMAAAALCIQRDDIDGALTWVRDFLATVPYCERANSEGHWQQLLYVLLSLLGYTVDVEVRTPTGRVDMVCMTRTRRYVVEIKVGKSAEAAMRQIDLKEYDRKFQLSDLPITKVGISFDTEKHTLAEWATD